MDQQGAIDARLHPRGEEFIARTFAIGLPIVDGNFVLRDGDQIIFREQTKTSKRRGEGGFG